MDLNEQVFQSIVNNDLARLHKLLQHLLLPKKSVDGLGVDELTVNTGGAKALHVAAYDGRTDIVKYLLQTWKASVDVFDDMGNTPLLLAAKSGRVDAFQLLLQAGADVNAANSNDGVTPLHWAVAYNWQKAINGFSRNRTQINEFPPTLLRQMIGLGADANRQNRSGETPLHYAAKWSENPQVAEVLLKSGGARVNAPNRRGRTALHFVRSVPVARVLVRAGGDANARDEDGDTPLHWAARRSDPRLLQLLIDEATGRVGERNGEGKTALHFAGSVHTAAVLVTNGGQLNIRDNDGVPLLEWRVNARQDVVDYLASVQAFRAALGRWSVLLGFERRLVDDSERMDDDNYHQHQHQLRAEPEELAIGMRQGLTLKATHQLLANGSRVDKMSIAYFVLRTTLPQIESTRTPSAGSTTTSGQQRCCSRVRMLRCIRALLPRIGSTQS